MVKYSDTLMWKEINETPSVFRTIKSNNATNIDKIVEEIKARNIKFIYAVTSGTSDHALIYFKYAMEVLTGIPVCLGANSIVTLYNGRLDLSECLVIGCSQSGKAVDVLELLKFADSQGALTLAVTNDTLSPMAKFANHHIYCGAGVEKSVAATKTFSSQLFCLIMLAASIANDKEILAELDNLADNSIKAIPAIDNLTTIYADKYKDMKSGFVLSRGITYAIALEATLKLQETAYIQMKGYATSDFFHGPMAMVSSETTVIIYAPRYNFGSKELYDNFINDIFIGVDKMISLNAPVLVVTDDENVNKKYSGVCDVALIPTSKNEFFTMFSFAYFAQMFACKVSCGIGNNPDSPRALNKVTITK